jgi:hypothetical protein
VLRTATFAAVLLVALAGAAAALAGRGDPKKAITKVDQARAKAMLVRRSDLAPGFKASPQGKDSNAYCAALDESDLTVTGDAESPDYTLQAPGRLISITSQAQLYRTSKQALASWRRGTSAAGERCAAKELTRAIGSSGGKFRSLRRMTFSKVAPLTVAYRVTAQVTSGLTTVPVYVDVVVLQRGRAQAAFFVFSLGAPLVQSETIAFAKLTAARMARAMGG